MILGNRITIIEPHADDAFLSLGGHIALWVKQKANVKIVTVYSGTRKRAADAETYAKAVGAAWEGLGYVEAGDGAGTGAGVGEFPFPLPYIVSRDEVVITPLGLQHPEHKAVRAAMSETNLHYLDQPYAAAIKNAAEVQSRLVDTKIVSYLKPSAHKYRHIPIFKDQSKFFFYNPKEKLVGNIELIVEDCF